MAKTENERRHALSNDEAMADAQRLCVECKLCGGSAKITDAGPGWGYYIACENAVKSRPTCMVGETRRSGWAYNVMELWNLLHDDADAIRIRADEAKALLYGQPQHEFSAALTRIGKWLAEIDDTPATDTGGAAPAGGDHGR